MMGFAIGATLLVGVALLPLLLSLRASRPAGADLSRRQINAAIYRDELAELESDRAEGSLAQADYEQARAELQRRLIEDSGEEAAAPAAPAASRVVPAVVAVGLPLVAVLIYLALGNPAALNQQPQEKRFTADDIERMVAGLAAKLEKEPGNLQGWAMLARSYKAMGRFPDALRAFERAGSMVDENADLLVEYADTLAASSGFDKKVSALIDKALKLDPTHAQGLWLRGTIAFAAQQYDKALADWEALLKLLPPDSENAQVVRGNLAEARELKVKAGKRK